ncbi:hypothetical protein CyaNS01_02145 [Cyanobium sp. NS01]|nr:hypothetical protein CyaNS01_02145 [Cyanobium sp. NS01]
MILGRKNLGGCVALRKRQPVVSATRQRLAAHQRRELGRERPAWFRFAQILHGSNDAQMHTYLSLESIVSNKKRSQPSASNGVDTLQIAHGLTNPARFLTNPARFW